MAESRKRVYVILIRADICFGRFASDLAKFVAEVLPFAIYNEWGGPLVRETPQTLQKYNERINAFLGRTPTYPPICQDCFWSKFFFWIWGKAFRWFLVGFPGRFRGVWEEPQTIFKCEYEGATICKFLGTICNFFLIGPLVLAWYWVPEVDSLTRTESSPGKPKRLQRCYKMLQKEVGLAPYGFMTHYSMTDCPSARLNSRERESLNIHHAMHIFKWLGLEKLFMGTWVGSVVELDFYLIILS